VTIFAINDTVRIPGENGRADQLGQIVKMVSTITKTAYRGFDGELVETETNHANVTVLTIPDMKLVSTTSDKLVKHDIPSGSTQTTQKTENARK
jgi:hypothetical protein